MNPQVTVIIPVYNGKDYIGRCLDSIINSSNPDLQIIVVDDGSDDGTLKIAQKYADADGRILCLHQKNKGVSAARNLAFPYIKGEWTCFVDADDCVSPDFLSIEEELANADVIEKPYKVVGEDGAELEFHVPNEGFSSQRDFFRHYLLHHVNALWNKIFATRLIQNKRFDKSFGLGEDFFFFMSIIGEIRSYRQSTHGFYMYTNRFLSAKNGVMSVEAHMDYYVQCVEKLQRDFIDKGIVAPLAAAFIYHEYVRALYYNKDVLTPRQKQFLTDNLRRMKLSDISLLPVRLRLRILLRHYQTLLK